MEQIKSFRITGLLIAPHYGFHKTTVDEIEQITPLKLHINEVFPQYKNNVEKEKSVLSLPHTLPETQSLIIFDNERDAELRRLFKTTKDLMRHPNEERRYNGREIWFAISGYDGVWKNEMNKQTALVKSMIYEIRENNSESTVEQFLGSGFIDVLEAMNNNFEKAMDDRIKKLALKEQLDLDILRHETNKLYREIRLLINAFAIAMPTGEIIEFITRHNELIDRYRRVLSGMRRGGSGNEKIPPQES